MSKLHANIGTAKNLKLVLSVSENENFLKFSENEIAKLAISQEIVTQFCYRLKGCSDFHSTHL